MNDFTSEQSPASANELAKSGGLSGVSGRDVSVSGAKTRWTECQVNVADLHGGGAVVAQASTLAGCS